jgi:hypothetical protein
MVSANENVKPSSLKVKKDKLTYWRSECTASFSLSTGTRQEVSGQLHNQANLPVGKESVIPPSL